MSDCHSWKQQSKWSKTYHILTSHWTGENIRERGGWRETEDASDQEFGQMQQRVMVLSCCLPALKPELHELVQLSLNYHLLLHYRRKNQKNMMFPCWQDSADFEHYIPLDLSVDLNPTKMKTCKLPQVRIKSKWTQYT